MSKTQYDRGYLSSSIQRLAIDYLKGKTIVDGIDTSGRKQVLNGKKTATRLDFFRRVQVAINTCMFYTGIEAAVVQSDAEDLFEKEFSSYRVILFSGQNTAHKYGKKILRDVDNEIMSNLLALTKSDLEERLSSYPDKQTMVESLIADEVKRFYWVEEQILQVQERVYDAVFQILLSTLSSSMTISDVSGSFNEITSSKKKRKKKQTKDHNKQVPLVDDLNTLGREESLELPESPPDQESSDK